MSQRTLSDTPIRLEAVKRIFIFRPKIDFSLRDKSMLFGQKIAKFSTQHFS